MEKKTVILICGSVVGLLVLLLLAVLVTAVFNPRYYTYEEAEELIKIATEKYYNNNPGYLPVDDGKYSLSYDALTTSELIKPLGELIEGGEVCSAFITVVKQGDNISYIPILNCGESYTTRSLADKVLSDNTVVSTDSGLYLDNETGEYYFKGKVNNNYVAYGSYTKKSQDVPFLWRIVSIKDGEIKLKSVSNTNKKVTWDSRYNNDIEKNYGYNDFDYSEISEALKGLENDFSAKYSDEKFELTKLKATNLCIGKRKLNEPFSSGNIECNKLSADKYFFGTITPYEYMRASTDENCKNATSLACQNFNFLANQQTSEWSVITTSDNSYSVLGFNGVSYELYRASLSRYIYPTITLSEFAYYKGGSGTATDPYYIR